MQNVECRLQKTIFNIFIKIAFTAFSAETGEDIPKDFAGAVVIPPFLMGPAVEFRRLFSVSWRVSCRRKLTTLMLTGHCIQDNGGNCQLDQHMDQ